MKLPLHSLRWRLQVWHALISLALIVAACFLADRLVTREQTDGLKRELRDYERAFFTHGLMRDRDPGENTPPTLAEIKESLRNFPLQENEIPPSLAPLFQNNPQSPYLGFWDKDGTLLYQSSNAPSTLAAPPLVAQPSSWESSTASKHLRLYRTHPSGIRMIVGRDISTELASLTRFRLILTLGGSALFLASLAGGWWLAGRALAPIDAISLTASRIAAGNLDERIQVQEDDSELNRLASVLNGTFDQLSASIERQKRFTADASHELRTPLTIILSETQRGLRRERDADSYRGIISNCHTAAERMRRLVDSLLLLAREDLTEEGTKVIDLADIARETAKQLTPLADQHDTTLTLDLTAAEVLANPSDLETVTNILLSNALSHTPPGTPVTVRTRIAGDHALLEVHDQGPGIPAEHLPHLCERFYQVDKARSQSQNHSGLGLSIAQTLAHKHHGTLEMTSSQSSPTGTTATVRLPLCK
ncbi:MAG: ATP-binding protein [Verrucomicrobiota bacterium JB023]|nr:ATP-binding protein [Verrucomicrobiota bacterium JB023]